MKKIFKVILLAVMLAFATGAYAQDEGGGEGGGEGGADEGGQEPAAPTTMYKKTTVYDFEDDTISGDLTKPDGEYLESRKRSRHQNLIKIRDDFNDRVIDIVRSLE